MKQAHAFKVTELALRAQAEARTDRARDAVGSRT